MNKKQIEALQQELTLAKAIIKQQKTWNNYMQKRYKDLIAAQVETNILPAAVLTQLATINLNVGEWERDGPLFVLHIPAITLKTPMIY